MHVLFDESGKFLAGRILSETEVSAQVELDSGKRVKVKAANILLRFDKPLPAELMVQAHAVSQSIELDLAWEFAPTEEFSFSELAQDYFSAAASTAERAGTLIALQEAPHYFRRAGKGRFRKASADILAQALAAIEKKKQIAQQVQQWAQALSKGDCPVPIREQLYKILFKPDKNAPEYKAVVEASRASQTGPLALLIKAGAIDSAYQFHWRRFLFENFPKGTGFPKFELPAAAEELPVASVRAFSIDDSATTEIDDALSVQGLGSGTATLGIHIAAPGLGIHPGDALDQMARSRLSTVYVPGHKITMLPAELVERYTLREGQACPALSLYLQIHEETLEIINSQTRIERVLITDNLRHDRLDHIVTLAWLEDPAYENAQDPEALQQARASLSFLHRLACQRKAVREAARGKPETFNRPDYNYRLRGHDPDCPQDEPQGDETVEISVRQRGAPLDLIVSEAMILANSTWGNWLAELGVPAIYRSQASLAPGVKVRMGTKPLAHAGIGVKSYAWSTSPLRRYVDLVNQWQIMACVRHGTSAALAAPFKPKDAELFSIISGFDAAYTAYNAFQSAMERFWVLQYIRQNSITEIEATVFKENLARADELPLVLPVTGAQSLPRGSRVSLRLGPIDQVALDIHGSVLARLDQAPSVSLDDEDDSEEDMAGPLAIAVDVNEEPEETSPSGQTA